MAPLAILVQAAGPPYLNLQSLLGTFKESGGERSLAPIAGLWGWLKKAAAAGPAAHMLWFCCEYECDCDCTVACRVGTMRSAGGRGIGRRENVAFVRAVVSATGGGVGSRRGRGPSRGVRGGGGGGARNGGGSRRVVSQADLDKDLENYMQE